MLCNNTDFESWSDKVQHAVIDSAAEATAAQRMLASKEDEEILAKLDPAKNKIVKLTDDERASFAQATASVIEKHRKEIGDELLSSVQ